jgi:hypothetical protein
MGVDVGADALDDGEARPVPVGQGEPLAPGLLPRDEIDDAAAAGPELLLGDP